MREQKDQRIRSLGWVSTDIFLSTAK